MISCAVIIFLLVVGFALPFAFRYVVAHRWGERVTMTVDPFCPRSEDVANYFREIAVSLDEHPRRMILVLDGRNKNGMDVMLDFSKEKNMIAVVGSEKTRFSLRERWISEHPVPLVFSKRKKRLYILPVDANRFRVMSSIPFTIPIGVYVLLTLLFSIGLFIPSLYLMVVSTALFISLFVIGKDDA